MLTIFYLKGLFIPIAISSLCRRFHRHFRISITHRNRYYFPEILRYLCRSCILITFEMSVNVIISFLILNIMLCFNISYSILSENEISDSQIAGINNLSVVIELFYVNLVSFFDRKYATVSIKLVFHFNFNCKIMTVEKCD